jgi:hypothetical protein
MKSALPRTRWLVFLLLALAPVLACAQEVLRRHSGATDPVSEGFKPSLSGGSTVGPLTNDLGVASWEVSSAGYPAGYSLSLTSEERAKVAGQDLALSATLRIVQGHNMFIILYAGPRRFLLGFDQQSDGDPVVSAESGPPFSLDPVFVFEGGGPGYHSYEVAYSAATASAALWVDGLERVGLLPSYSGDWAWGGYWGAAQGGRAQANWSSVTFAIVPEPSLLALLGWGASLFCPRLWCRRGVA